MNYKAIARAYKKENWKWSSPTTKGRIPDPRRLRAVIRELANMIPKAGWQTGGFTVGVIKVVWFDKKLARHLPRKMRGKLIIT